MFPPKQRINTIRDTDGSRKRAKTDDEKEQRRIERVLRNRAAAQTSRERKRLEMEKLENEKIQMEQQNQFLLQRLNQIEAENNRLNKQVAQLSAEVRGSSRGSTPNRTIAAPPSPSPTLTPTLFKQERDELPLDRIPFPTPASLAHATFSPTLKPSTLDESTDPAQHPAAVLCGLQCPSVDSTQMEAPSPSLTSASAVDLTLQMTLRLLFLTMTSTASSTVILPLTQILRSLKTGSPLTFSTAEISRHFPLILWLISTPSLSSPSRPSTRPTVFRMRLLARLLACNPALARPLRDATGRALQRAVSARVSPADLSGVEAGAADGWSWEALLTLIWAIDCLQTPGRRRRVLKGLQPAGTGRKNRVGKSTTTTTTTITSRTRRYGGSSRIDESVTSLLGKQC